MHKTILVPTNSTTNILYVSKNELFGDFIATPHNHPCIEILYFSEGEGTVVINNNKINVGKGDVMLINKGTRHYEESKNNNLCFIAIGIKELEAILPSAIEKRVLYKNLSENDANEARLLFDIIYQECSLKELDYFSVIENSIKSILTIIKRETVWDFLNIEPAQYSNIVASCKNLIDNYFYEPLSVDLLSKRLNISCSRLSHLFKQELGTTIIKYRLDKQLEEGDNLLKITNHSITEISTKIGFSSTSYFTKIFKKKYGKTPKEVRTEAKEKLSLNEK